MVTNAQKYKELLEENDKLYTANWQAQALLNVVINGLNSDSGTPDETLASALCGVNNILESALPHKKEALGDVCAIAA